MYFYILFIYIQVSTSFELYLEKDKTHLIAKDKSVDIHFRDESISQTKCHPSKLYVENSDNKYTKFLFSNNQEKSISITLDSPIYDSTVLDIQHT
jgi:signal peptide peptidase-like protein 2B